MPCPVCGGALPPPAPTGRPRVVCSARCRKARHLASRRVPVTARGSERVEWYTPADVLAEYAARWGPFELDPAADPRAPAWGLVPRHYTREQDGLRQPWTAGRVWCNPPYGRELPAWTGKAAAEVREGRAELVVLLVPARTDTRWWADAILAGARPYFRTGRIRFLSPRREGSSWVLEQRNPAAFPSAALVFRSAAGGTKPPAVPPSL